MVPNEIVGFKKKFVPKIFFSAKINLYLKKLDKKGTSIKIYYPKKFDEKNSAKIGILTQILLLYQKDESENMSPKSFW